MTFIFSNIYKKNNDSSNKLLVYIKLKPYNGINFFNDILYKLINKLIIFFYFINIKFFKNKY
jgi:hypothetical protein